MDIKNNPLRDKEILTNPRVDERHLDINKDRDQVEDQSVTFATNPGAPQDNIPGRGNEQGVMRGSAQIGTQGRGSQVGSEFDVSDED